MIRKSHQGPIYREIISQAIQTAWHDRQYWILALLAGLLLTAGSYDVLWNAMNNIVSQGQYISISAGAALLESVARTSVTGFDRAVSIIGGVETLMFMAIILVFLAALSCIAQGGLVYALGARKRGIKPTLKDAFKIGAAALWPVVALNVVALAVVWIIRFLVSLPLFLALEQTSTTTFLVYLISFMVFLPLVFLISIIQIFALNALILQGAPLSEALRRGYLLFKKHWVVVLETAVVQAVIAIGIWLLFLVSFMLLMTPLFVFILAAASLQSVGLFSLAMFLGSIIFIASSVVVAAFTIQLQYATWTYLYRRLGEGGIVPKLHRIMRNVTGFFTVPQS